MSFDGAAENRAFSEKFNFNFPLLCDTDRSMGMDYGACDSDDSGYARRIGIVLDENGVVIAYTRNANASSYPKDALALLATPEDA